VSNRDESESDTETSVDNGVERSTRPSFSWFKEIMFERKLTDITLDEAFMVEFYTDYVN
jgi:hypothetical protein